MIELRKLFGKSKSHKLPNYFKRENFLLLSSPSLQETNTIFSPQNSGTGTDGVCAVCAIGFFPSSPTLPCPCPSGATCFLSSGGSALGLNYCNPGFYGNNVPYLSPCLPCGGLLWAPGGLPILLICNLCGKYATTCNHVNGWAKTW